MMGKVSVSLLVGLTQFAIWIVLTLVFFLIFGQPLSFQAEVASTSDFSAVYSMLMSINWIEMLVCFVAYFIGGYLLYASIFAAIGSAVDNEADTQQFMLLIPFLFCLPCMRLFIVRKTPMVFGVLVFDDSVYFAHCDDGKGCRSVCCCGKKLFLW